MVSVDEVKQEIEAEQAQNGESVSGGTSDDSASLDNPSVEEGLVEDDVGEVNEADLEALGPEGRTALIDALIVANGEPISVSRLEQATKLCTEDVEAALAAIRERCSHEESGVELVAVAGNYQFRTKACFSQFIRALKAGTPRRLSHPALETLAIIAYRQPIVKSEIERIRGVDATPTLKTLLEKGLVKIVGHQQTVGLPALYGTTEDFLKIFGLNSLAELPTLRDLKELDADPGESQSADGQAVVANG